MKYFIFKFILFLSLLLISLYGAVELSYLFISYPEDHLYSEYLWLVLIYFISYFYHKLMTKRMVTSTEAVTILKANVISTFFSFSLVFITKESDEYSRSIILLFFIITMSLPIAVYFIKKYFFKYSILRENILVVCDKNSISNVKNWLLYDNAFGFDIKQTIIIDNLSQKEIIESINQAISNMEFYTAVLAIDRALSDESLYYIDYIQERIKKVIVLPKMSSMPLFNAEIISSINHKGLAFFLKNNLLNPVDIGIKKIFDYIVSMFLILISSPFLFILYIIVFISTDGYPIFKHRRIGKDGKDFNIYKFRTMYIDAEERLAKLLKEDIKLKKEWEAEFKLKNDPRVTKVGKFLRKTSLDELPQILNVLQGKMSLVGPRPIITDEIAKYGEYFEYFKAVKPGITGLWQVSGRNDIDYDERVQLDVWYTRNWSIGLDLIILIKTFVAVLSRKGSY